VVVASPLVPPLALADKESEKFHNKCVEKTTEIHRGLNHREYGIKSPRRWKIHQEKILKRLVLFCEFIHRKR
jgi:hypothetical protein